jgi:signal transduction histidine kinase
VHDAHALNLSWLLRLRWGAIVGQGVLILGVHFGLGMSQRLGPLFATIAVAAASNVALGLWARPARPIREGLPWAVMALDVVLLTVLLDLSGGPFNPFSALSSGDSALEDVRLIRQQVARCRDILTQMATDAGASQGESMVARTPAALVEEALEGLPGRERVRVEADARAREERELVPAHAFARAIRGVVKNALQASEAEVRLGLVREAEAWRLAVEDAGAGMPAEVLARAGEPFFTTKAPGEGMGLGLFLTRAVLDQLGGRLELGSTPGQGTTVVLTWPAGGLRQSAALSPEPPRV